MRNREHQIQVACVNWFRMQYKDIIYAVPNAARRSVVMGKMMKDEGLLPGIPDLCIPVMRNNYGGLYIEMKDGKNGRLSDSQKEMIDRLRCNGYRVDVCRSVDDFMDVVNEYMR